MTAQAARIQDGTINNTDDFWQLVQDVAYLIDGEGTKYAQEKLAWMVDCMDKYFAAHPEINHDSDFAMYSSRRLINAVAAAFWKDQQTAK